eukprot:14351650-Alexandrium_andersonii.AAC.1
MTQALSHVDSRAPGLLPRLHLFLRIAAQSASMSIHPLASDLTPHAFSGRRWNMSSVVWLPSPPR